MSTKSERAFRSTRLVLPIKHKVRQKDGSVTTQRVDADVRNDKRSRKSGKQILKELPINHLSHARQRDLLLALIDEFRDGWLNGTASTMYVGAVQNFKSFDVDVQPLD